MQGSHQLKLKLQALVLLDLKLVKEQVIKTISPKNSDDELILNIGSNNGSNLEIYKNKNY